MRENMNKWNRSAEREVSIRELWWKILYGWRLIIISAVIFAVLLGGYSYAKSRQNVQNIEVQSALSEEDIEKSLSDEQREAVEQAESIQQQLEKKKEYQKDSILMNLDAYHQSVKKLQYYVNTNHTWNLNSEVTDDYALELLDGYGNYIKSKSILKDIKDTVKWQEEDVYIGELISEEGNGNSQDNVFVISITGKSEDEIEKLADAVETAVEAYQAKLAEKIGAHDLILVDTSESVIVNDELITKQEELNADIISIQTQLDTLTEGFDSAQKQILNGMEKGTVQEQNNSVKAGVSKKYILLGILAGILLSVLWIVICYIFNKKLKTAEECQELYNIRIFGSMTPGDPEKVRVLSGVDRWLNKKEGKENWTWEEQRELILTNLSVTCKKENIQKLLFTSSLYLEEEAKKRIYFFLEKLEEQGIEAIFAEDMLRNAKTFEQMSEIENVIFVEGEGATAYETLEKQLTLCEEQGANILGMIFFE